LEPLGVSSSPEPPQASKPSVTDKAENKKETFFAKTKVLRTAQGKAPCGCL
jgi:hypothetical protein